MNVSVTSNQYHTISHFIEVPAHNSIWGRQQSQNRQIHPCSSDKIPRFFQTFFHQSANPVCLDNQTQRSPPKITENPRKRTFQAGRVSIFFLSVQLLLTAENYPIKVGEKIGLFWTVFLEIFVPGSSDSSYINCNTMRTSLQYSYRNYRSNDSCKTRRNERIIIIQKYSENLNAQLQKIMNVPKT